MPKLKEMPLRPNLAELEESVLEYWQKNKSFEKSVEMRDKSKSYVFYDGPPFATGLPHYGHLLGSTSKDVVPRYWTMKGYRVDRVWGWDCHGLPIENMIEKQLNIKGGKKGIEDLGINKFNQACRTEVMRLDDAWKTIIDRLGRWVDFENNYKTMDITYMESVWWGFKQLMDKDLVYQGKKVVMYCPRCSTPLSNFEIAMDNSYEDVEDFSIYIKFKLIKKDLDTKNNKVNDGAREDVLGQNEYFLAWTTTPWTLPGNVALAVDKDADYVQVEYASKDTDKKELLWVAKDMVEKVFESTPNNNKTYKVIKTVKGSELVGIHYQPLFDYVTPNMDGAKNKPNSWSVLEANFVSMEDGTGIVHTAAIYGEDDYALALEKDLPLIPTLNDEGKFLPFVKLVAGKFYKGAEKTINEDLTKRGLMFKESKITHSYPFCYRCSTPLYYNAVPAWYINIQKLKKNLLEQNEKMNWYPEHLKHGRFEKGLETAPDWNISRSRYWGTPMPVWISKDKVKGETRETSPKHKQQRVIGSIEELKKWAVEPKQVEGLTDLHREFLDNLEVWIDDDRTVKGTRIPEVFDCWVESGSMPFASKHYPFENKKEFEKTYPAQFVSEYIAQTRAWFYTMHVISVGVFGKNAVENTLTTGTILAENGNKMSKSKKNYPDPMLLINKYGVDSLRLYLMSSSVMKSENINFSEREVSDIRKKVFLIWWNMFAFYKLYADKNLKISLTEALASNDIMDKWIISRLNTLIQDVTEYMDNYNLIKASRELMNFVNELSTWYLRRSRDRLRNSSSPSLSIFGFVLIKLSQLFAPITPFFSETMWHNLVDDKSSVHHSDWPITDKNLIYKELEEKMVNIRRVVEITLSLRSKAKIKIRQPLSKLTCFVTGNTPKENLLEVLADEVNVKKVEWKRTTETLRVVLDTDLNDELKSEGEARELMRNIQKLRKKAGLQVRDFVTVEAPEWPKDWKTEIEKKTGSKLIEGTELKIVRL
ncbi:isoleucine--tRNA ligase [Patescibacteria group bacterium]|nr:isoleucine--tRNA ligase [Patescibacteria group bacterium]